MGKKKVEDGKAIDAIAEDAVTTESATAQQDPVSELMARLAEQKARIDRISDIMRQHYGVEI